MTEKSINSNNPKSTCSNKSASNSPKKSNIFQSIWTEKDKLIYIEKLKKYGKNW